MSKRAIPLVPSSWQGQAKAFADAIKENVERITGQRGGQIKSLEENASTAEIISKINEIIRTIQ